jgi:hypothetical protein
MINRGCLGHPSASSLAGDGARAGSEGLFVGSAPRRALSLSAFPRPDPDSGRNHVDGSDE